MSKLAEPDPVDVLTRAITAHQGQYHHTVMAGFMLSSLVDAGFIAAGYHHTGAIKVVVGAIHRKAGKNTNRELAAAVIEDLHTARLIN